MTEETPPTGDGQPRDQAKPAALGADAENTGVQEDPRSNRPDENPDETSGARRAAALTTGVRRCTCCGNPLPPPTARQKKPRKYCPDGQGGYEERYGITCGELGPAKEKYELVFGHDAVPGEDLERLGEQIAAARDLLGPDSPLAGLFGALTGTLADVGGRLDGTVTAALAETARATAAEREALGREAAMLIERDAANDLAQQAVIDRQDMERDRNTKVRAAEQRAVDAEAAQHRAEIAKGKAEEARDQQKDRADRADQAAQTAREERDDVVQTNTRLLTQIEELKAQLEQANTRAKDERGRADKAVEEAGKTRTEAEQKLELLRKETDKKVEQARAETTRQAAEHNTTLERIGQERAAELAEHARLLAEANGRTEQLRQHVRQGLARLLRNATTAPVEPSQDDDLAQQLLRATTTQADLRHGIEDLVQDLEID